MPGSPFLLRHPFARTFHQRSRNIDLVPIGYAFQPRLRYRLTLGRLTLPRNPWAFGERVFHPLNRYLCLHTLFRSLYVSSPVTLHSGGMFLYHTPVPAGTICVRSFGVVLEPRYIFGARPLDQ